MPIAKGNPAAAECAAPCPPKRILPVAAGSAGDLESLRPPKRPSYRSRIVEFLSDSLGQELQRVQAQIHAVFDTDNRLIREVGAYITQSGGKRIRPALTILAAQSCGRPVDDAVIALATSIELFHVATLLHDDVIDEAATRRGRPSVNAKWSDSVAILMADYLYAQAFDKALLPLKPEIGRVLCQVTSKMCEGELYQIEKEGHVLRREDYYKIIENKTAYLFSASVGLGGMIAEAATHDVQHLAQFGLNFGMAFQITDDTLDYTAQDEKWGKGVGTDIANGKQTLPLIYTLEVAEPGDRTELLRLLNNGREFSDVLRHIQKYRGLDHARQVASDFSSKAIACLERLSPSAPAAIMRQLCEYVTGRNF